MLSWIFRILFLIAGSIASLFVARDALNFSLVQMVITVFLFTLTLAIMAFWTPLKQGLKQLFKK